ncbi:MAG TPA: type II secretion system protein [Armatimonadetes bacterium]|jgi:prepilin-type N-terminal cleavage/methylation domain-containing protein|nr:type II secretion system protein [Armatimonadota bacterium]
MTRVRITRESRQQAGYTLIEAVMAILVISIALLGVFQVVAGAIGTNADSRNRALATRFAERQLEAARGAAVSSLSTSAGNTDPQLSRWLGPSAEWDLTVNDVTSRLKGITVTVRWRDGTLDQAVSLSTLAHTAGVASIGAR